MQYLVTMEYVDPGPLVPPQQVGQLVEQVVLPGFEALGKLKAEKKILAGGVVAGTRTLAFIVDVADNDELDKLLETNPFWGIMKTDATPLQDFEKRAAQDRQSLEQLKAAQQ